MKKPNHYKLIGILGGTFDPVHNGHIAIAQFLLQQLAFEQIQFIPCHQPSHRMQPSATAEQRLHMLQLALQSQAKCVVNDLELKRSGPSYMVETLTILQQQFSDCALALIMGADVFATFNQWHRWQDILPLAHLIVVNRPHYQLPQAAWLNSLLQQYQCTNSNALYQQRSGFILQQEIPEQLTSASSIRQHLQQGISIAAEVPAVVAAYITEHRLYLSLINS